MTRSPGAARRPVSPEGWGLLALYAFTAVAVLGYGLFGLNPGRIPQVDALYRFYAISFNFFAQAHIWICAAVLLVPLVRRVGVRWLPAFGAVYLLSFTSEFVGTGYGIPFGGYGYTGLLGPKLGGRVPVVIPLSWFLMALPAWVLAMRTFPLPGRSPARVVFAASLLVIWDLALDPAMSYLTPYWRWADSGPYYGMPWLNLVGWFATGVVIIAAIEGLGGRRWGPELPWRWMAGYYGAVLLMPLGMLAAAGEWLAVGVTLAALGLAWGVHRLAASPEPRPELPAMAADPEGA